MTGAAPVLAWLAAGAGLLLLPPVGRRLVATRTPRSAAGPGAPARARPLFVAGAVAVVAVLVWGPVRGAAVAAVVAPGAAAGMSARSRRARRPGPDRSIALVLDLAAAALHGGRPVADALVLSAPAADPELAAALMRVAGLLRLGAPPGQAWSVVATGPLEQVAAVAVRSAASGVRLAAAFERTAAEIRTECAASAAEHAHRAGVAAMGPLAACFLPSFVCLGIVPIVIGIARSALGVLP